MTKFLISPYIVKAFPRHPHGEGTVVDTRSSLRMRKGRTCSGVSCDGQNLTQVNRIMHGL